MSLFINYTDEALVERMQADDEGAFTELYNRYWKRLISRAMTQLKYAQDAEDVLHDVFVSIWNRRKRIVLKYSFGTYIAAILKYEIINKLAERKKKNTDTIDDCLQPFFLDDSTRQQLEYHELQERLEASVQQLPEKCRLVFRLSREQGLKTKEIAEVLNISPKTVQNHINHALGTLRSALNNFISLLL
ncbi:RNA polymerase sigma factor [Arachidicoccus soli]|uniref:RNA polymerase sigma-70 factor n=1 Tax=Arachidicoccus soli TaxID=2341117 RepID=A0A386HNW6_9BACT|nr:RNA polymerase sigma-70 factor [Arachidicoccus soli]AYD47329.1 RNA polymerase sigma-70 factor [Arachidicoccus soli]